MTTTYVTLSYVILSYSVDLLQPTIAPMNHLIVALQAPVIKSRIFSNIWLVLLAVNMA